MTKILGIKAVTVILFLLLVCGMSWAHDISRFDVGTRITMWVTHKQLVLGFLVELKNFPAQDHRTICDLNKDMEVDESEKKYFVETCCRKFIDNLHVKVNGREMAKEIRKADILGLIGPVDRGLLSSYIEAVVPIDPSLYRVKIEYVNDNFRNEDPNIINDVNISVNKELDNLNICPITPINQYLDAQHPDHRFMEMTLKREFSIEFGYKDIGTASEPFAANEIMLVKESGKTSRASMSQGGTPGASGWSQRLYKWLENFAMTEVEKAMKARGLATWMWLVVIGVFVGLVHVLLPGHGKGVVLSYVGAVNARPKDAAKLAVMITVVHTISTAVLAAFIMILAGKYLASTVKNVGVVYLTLGSGLLIAVIGLYMLLFFRPVKWRREEQKEQERVEKALGGEDEDRSRFSLMWKLALATGIIPCITSSAAAVLFFQYEEYLKAFLMIGFIAVGQVITLSLIGVASAGGFEFLRRRAERRRRGLLVLLVGRTHRIVAVLLIILGAYGFWLGWQWRVALTTAVQVKTAAEKIEMYEAGLKENPADFDAHFELGLLYAGAGDLAGALSHFEAASRIKPEDVDSMRFAGHALARTGKHKEALEWYNKALAGSPGDANLLFNVAYVESLLDRNEDAIAHYGKAGSAAQDPKAWFNLGLAYEKESRLDDALKQYLRAAEGRPGDAGIRMAIANVYRNKKEYEKAAEHLLAARERNPASAELNLSLANIYLRRLCREEMARPYVKGYLENGGRAEIEAAIEELAKQEVTAPMHNRWDAPEAARKFERIGACGVPFLAEAAGKAAGEQLKSVLAALAATEAPQAVPCILAVFGDKERWKEEDLYASDYGPGLGPPPIPVIAEAAFVKCMRGVEVKDVLPRLVEVAEERNQREYFLSRLYYEKCSEYPFELMNALLTYGEKAPDEQVKRVASLGIDMKGERLALADDPDTARAALVYLKKWWEKNRDGLLWDKLNYCFRKKDDAGE
jgi:tetratricopeptide (TPR) repeat protein/ABC-type nickel/cobalt efflux system permease component RcnA